MYYSRPTQGQQPTSCLVITVFTVEDNTAFFAITMFSLTLFVPDIVCIFHILAADVPEA